MRGGSIQKLVANLLWLLPAHQKAPDARLADSAFVAEVTSAKEAAFGRTSPEALTTAREAQVSPWSFTSLCTVFYMFCFKNSP